MYRKSDLFTIFVLVLVFDQTCGAGADLGAACNVTADCDTTTTATAVCDVLATPKVCKIESTGDCTGKTDKCVSGAACTSNACTCSTKYKENAAKLCATVLGSTCTATADCTSTVANSDCTGTGTKTCTCATGYTQQGTACKADIGTACTATSDCDTTTTTTAVCDVLATPKVCKIKSTGACTGTTDKCVSNAACTSNLCVCSTKYKETAAKLCATVLGSTCTATADCTPTVANSDCTDTTGSKTCTCNAGFTAQGADCSGILGSTCTATADCTSTVDHSDCTGTDTKTCTCATGYTQQGEACKADIGTACTATSDCDTTTTTTAVCDVLATPKVCKIKSTGACTGTTDMCVSGAACTSNLCACSTKYKENAAKLCATVLGSTCTATADCTPTVVNSDCIGSTGSKTCTCNAGFTAQGADCSGATSVAACLAMILACIFTTIV